MNKTSKSGFTLAEVLITLSIIGIVAAITIPTLISTYRKKQLEAQVKVTYANIQQTLRYAEYEDISYKTVADGSSRYLKEWFDSFLSKHMKVEQVCVDRNPKGGWHQVYYPSGLKHGDADGIGTGILGFTTAKGVSVTLDGYNANNMTNVYGIDTNESGLIFYFDANGKTKPNVLGKDVFIMAWTEKGLIPAGYSKTSAQIETNCYSGNGFYCLNKVISNDWKIPTKIWNKKVPYKK